MVRRDAPDAQVPRDDADGAHAGHPFEAIVADVIPALAARLRASRLAELEVRTAAWRVRVRRDTEAVAEVHAGAPRGSPSGTTIHHRDAAASRLDGTGEDGGIARSPAVGYFQPSPAAEVGRSVRSGDLLGHVEMLGIHHDVPAPVDGVILRALAQSGQAVEYGQPLILVQAGGPVASAAPSAPDFGAD